MVAFMYFKYTCPCRSTVWETSLVCSRLTFRRRWSTQHLATTKVFQWTASHHRSSPVVKALIGSWIQPWSCGVSGSLSYQNGVMCNRLLRGIYTAYTTCHGKMLYTCTLNCLQGWVLYSKGVAQATGDFPSNEFLQQWKLVSWHFSSSNVHFHGYLLPPPQLVANQQHRPWRPTQVARREAAQCRESWGQGSHNWSHSTWVRWLSEGLEWNLLQDSQQVQWTAASAEGRGEGGGASLEERSFLHCGLGYICRFESTIIGQFFGHTHTDSFSVFYDDQNTTRATKLVN